MSRYDVPTHLLQIYIPTAAASALYGSIPGAADASSTLGAGYYTFPCSSTLAAINLSFGGKDYPLDFADFNLGAASSGSSSCVGGIIGEDTSGQGQPAQAIIGDEWIKNWYTVFDYGNSVSVIFFYAVASRESGSLNTSNSVSPFHSKWDSPSRSKKPPRRKEFSSPSHPSSSVPQKFSSLRTHSSHRTPNSRILWTFHLLCLRRIYI